MSTPLYDINDTVYLKESAALGFLEAVRISGIVKQAAGWLYTIEARSAQPTAPTLYGDRIAFTNRATLYFSEDELITLCNALDLAEAHALAVLSRIQAQKQEMCGNITGV